MCELARASLDEVRRRRFCSGEQPSESALMGNPNMLDREYFPTSSFDDLVDIHVHFKAQEAGLVFRDATVHASS